MAAKEIKAQRRSTVRTPRSGEKTVVSVRMPRTTYEFVERLAHAEALKTVSAQELEGPEGDRLINITMQINIILDALSTFFRLPDVLRERLEQDEKALSLGRLEYFQHVIYRRSEQVGQHGPGFDKAPVEKAGKH